MSSSGFSARASLYRDLRSGSRTERSASPVSFPPPAPPLTSPSGELAVALSDLGLGVGVSTVQDPSARGSRGSASASMGGDFVSVPSGRSFGDQFLVDATMDPGASTESRESFSLGGLTETDLLAATLCVEAKAANRFSVQESSNEGRESSASLFKSIVKPEAAKVARDTSQFADYGLAETREVSFHPDARSNLTKGELPAIAETNPSVNYPAELQNSVALFAVDLKEDKFCGAVVGVAGKFCLHLKGQCPKKSHRKASSFLGSLRDQGIEECLFICVPVPKGNLNHGQLPTLAFQDPFLETTRLGRSKVQEMLQAHKPVWLWSSMFAMLSGEMQGQERELASSALPGTPLRHKSVEQLQADATQTAFTPARRLELEDVEVPSPTSEESELEDVDPLLDEDTFKNRVSRNTVTTAQVQRATASELTTMRLRQAEQNQLLNVLVDKVNVLSGLLGAPPEDSGATTVWQAISEWHQNQEEKKINPALLEAIKETQALHGASFQRMYDSINTLTNKLHDTKVEAIHSSRKEVVAMLTGEVNKAIWAELSKVSPTLKVAEKFFIRGGLSEFEEHIRRTTADAVRAAGGTNGQSSLFNLSQAEVEDIKRLIVKLEEESELNRVRLTDIEARSENYTVEIEGKQFSSLSQVAAFVASNNVPSSVLKFVDAISLMEKTTTGSQSFTENVDVHYCGQRSNMESPSDQKGLYSFQLIAPTALAGTPDQARTNPRKLARMDTYQKFKGSGSRDMGAANMIRKMIADKYPPLLSEIEASTMSREAKAIARFLLTESRNFLDSLFIFMKDQVEDYGADTKLSETRRWDLVQNITRIVFEVISQPRRGCSEITLNQATSPDRAPELLWSVLQSHRLQKEFLDHNFKNHPKVGPMLTHFLLDVVSFHDDVNPIVDDVKKALSEAQQAKRKVDAVESQVKNLQGRLPSKKAKANKENSDQA